MPMIANTGTIFCLYDSWMAKIDSQIKQQQKQTHLSLYFSLPSLEAGPLKSS